MKRHHTSSLNITWFHWYWIFGLFTLWSLRLLLRWFLFFFLWKGLDLFKMQVLALVLTYDDVSFWFTSTKIGITTTRLVTPIFWITQALFRNNWVCLGTIEDCTRFWLRGVFFFDIDYWIGTQPPSLKITHIYRFYNNRIKSTNQNSELSKFSNLIG